MDSSRVEDCMIKSGGVDDDRENSILKEELEQKVILIGWDV